jgi:AraC-like DNA-binding protein/ligand-binding sensor domain-containing protein
MKRLYNAVLILILTAFFQTLVFPLNYQKQTIISPFIQHYSPQVYNESPQNWAVIQDRRGVMFFANTWGILEFDGKYWRNIPVSNNSIVRSLAMDKNGRIYVGAQDELGFLTADAAGALYYQSLIEKVDENQRNFNDVWKTLAAEHGIYFLTNRKILRWRNNSMDVIPFDLSPYLGFVIRDNLFIISAHGGLYLLKDDIPLLLPQSEQFKRSIVHNIIILPYKDNKLLIVTGSGKCFIYHFDRLFNEKTKSYDLLETVPNIPLVTAFKTETSDYIHFETNFLYSGIRINPDLYALTTLQGGIVLMDSQGKLLRIFNRAGGLGDDRVWALATDRQKNLWAALNNGISYIEISSAFSVFNELSGLNEYCLSLIRWKGQLYVGTMQGIYRSSQPRQYLTPGGIDNSWRDFVPIKGNRLSCWEFIDFQNRLFAGCENGLFEILGDTAVGYPDTNRIRGIYCFGTSSRFPGYLFLGFHEGLAVCNITPATESLPVITKIRYLGSIAGISETIRKITSDDDGNLWLSTNVKGIIYLRFTGDDVKHPRIYRLGRENGLPTVSHNYADFFHNQLWLGTQQGVYKLLNPGEEQPEHYRFGPDEAFSRSSEEKINVLQIFPDNKNRLWVNSYNDQGIALFTRQEDGNYSRHTIPFKKIPKICGQLYLDADETLWFATANGLYRYDPLKNKDYHEPFPALIRKVTAGKDSVIFHGAYPVSSQESPKTASPSPVSSSRIPVPVDSKNPVFYQEQPTAFQPILPYKKNSILFEYAAIYYESGPANVYSYHLEGFDTNWSDWTKKNEKEYTNLPEGHYIFRVKAANLFGTVSNESSFRFRILPPWYRGTIAYIIYGLLIIVLLVLLFLFYRYRINQVILREQKKYDLEPELISSYLKKLILIMEKEKPHLNPNLTINGLSQMVGLPYYQLSQIINKKLNKNFFDFINEYRIKEAQQLLSDPKRKGDTVLDVAYNVGFNTKSSFNNAFKRFTGTTPSAYRKGASKEWD